MAQHELTLLLPRPQIALNGLGWLRSRLLWLVVVCVVFGLCLPLALAALSLRASSLRFLGRVDLGALVCDALNVNFLVILSQALEQHRHLRGRCIQNRFSVLLGFLQHPLDCFVLLQRSQNARRADVHVRCERVVVLNRRSR